MTHERSEMPEPEYELLTVDTVADYVANRRALAERLARVDAVREVGDGNLNLVFVVSGKAPDGDDASLVVKQALPYVRADPSWPMSPARNHAEARALRIHGRLSPAAVPALYDVDPQRYAFTIEDLSDHRVWRAALNDGERHADAAAALGRYVADVAFGTSAFGVDAEQLKPLAAEAINPPLCKITELLVFSEPYTARRASHGSAGEPRRRRRLRRRSGRDRRHRRRQVELHDPRRSADPRRLAHRIRDGPR